MCLIEIFSESSENNLIQIKLFDDPKPQLDVDIQKLFHFLSKGYYEVAAQTTKFVAHNRMIYVTGILISHCCLQGQLCGLCLWVLTETENENDSGNQNYVAKMT